MHIRLIRDEDYDREDFQKALSQFPGKMTSFGVKFARKHRSSNPHLFTFLILDGYKCLGTASLLLDYKVHKDGKPAGLIEDVAVLPECHGQGIGKLLVSHLISFAKEKGCYKVSLCCKEDNVVFYEKCGFKRSQVEMRYYFEE